MNKKREIRQTALETSISLILNDTDKLHSEELLRKKKKDRFIFSMPFVTVVNSKLLKLNT